MVANGSKDCKRDYNCDKNKLGISPRKNSTYEEGSYVQEKDAMADGKVVR